ncbi:type II secretion system F family protein [Undibacterium cyanobacteriorum]|uniref:Type II secretion system F family protein n=1 Tax=Undibacterium cyanobacteriorum TaxID=3073561 RepID=A0ABY9RDR8_9BURK|nr:type II secretion system F family protein [Undibacterium sp. 20NA77.5]WMW79372.1 type II secretion system F family protein [Undibacterium sp. 20NA77.5]
MPFFSYKARNSNGDLVQGVLEALDADAVARQLFSNGVVPTSIEPATASGDASIPSLWRRIREGRVSPIDVQLFSRQLYTLIRAGVPIMRGLAGLQESSVNKAFRKVIQDLRESLDSGRELSAAMRRHPNVFSLFYVSMVRVGEMTGRLDLILLRLAEHLEFERDMRNRIKTALRYPVFVLAVMVIALVVVNIFVIPQFARVFASFNAPLPVLTQFLLGMSEFFVDYWYLIFAVVIGVVIAFRSFISTKAGRFWWDRVILKFPIFGRIVLKATLARFSRSFALSSKSGVPIVQALNVVASTVDNTFIAQHVENMREGVERGDSILRTATATNVFTPVVLQMIAVGEETGALDELMDEIATMYEGEVEYELKTLSSNIEPILIIILGVMVLVLALGVFVPIWDLGRVALKK